MNSIFVSFKVLEVKMLYIVVAIHSYAKTETRLVKGVRNVSTKLVAFGPLNVSHNSPSAAPLT